MGVNTCVACVETFVDCANEVLANATTCEEALDGLINCAIEMLNCIFGDDSAQAQALQNSRS